MIPQGPSGLIVEEGCGGPGSRAHRSSANAPDWRRASLGNWRFSPRAIYSIPSDHEFTGERLVSGIAGEIAPEHWHRYAFARREFVRKRGLDVGCGGGYGSAGRAGVATVVTGIDIEASAIAHARLSYAAVPNVRFDEGSAASLPLPDVRVDAVVSFETIEHLPRAYQPRMPAVIARALAKDGVRILLFGAACTKTQLQARGGAVVPRSSAVLVRRELVVDAPA